MPLGDQTSRPNICNDSCYTGKNRTLVNKFERQKKATLNVWWESLHDL